MHESMCSAGDFPPCRVKLKSLHGNVKNLLTGPPFLRQFVRAEEKAARDKADGSAWHQRLRRARLFAALANIVVTAEVICAGELAE